MLSATLEKRCAAMRERPAPPGPRPRISRKRDRLIEKIEEVRSRRAMPNLDCASDSELKEQLATQRWIDRCNSWKRNAVFPIPIPTMFALIQSAYITSRGPGTGDQLDTSLRGSSRWTPARPQCL